MRQAGYATLLLLAFAAMAARAGDETTGTHASAGERPAQVADEQAIEREALEPAVTSMPAAGREDAVMDELDLDRTEITGNRELPKVLYIVPWRKADPGDLTGRPVNSLIEEVLAPLDREEFIRQVDYYSDLDNDTVPGEETE